MFCKNCGKNIPNDGLFCPGCGTAVTPKSPSVPSPVENEAPIASAIPTSAPIENIEPSVPQPDTGTLPGAAPIVQDGEMPIPQYNEDGTEISPDGQPPVKSKNVGLFITLGVVAVLIIAAVALFLTGTFSSLFSDNMEYDGDIYFVAVTEDDLTFFLEGEELFSVDYENEYSLTQDMDGEYFMLSDDPDDNYNYNLRLIAIKDGDEVDIDDNVDSYSMEYAGGKIMFLQYDEDEGEYMLMYGDVDDYESISDTSTYGMLSPDGNSVIFMSEENTYLYTDGDDERVAKDAYPLDFIGKDGLLLVNDDNELLYYKDGDDTTIADDYYTSSFMMDDPTKALVLADWDDEDEEGVLYYFSSFTKDPIEIADDVESMYQIDMDGRFAVVSDGDLYTWEEGDKELTEIVSDYWELGWVTNYGNYYYWQDEEDLYRLKIGSDDDEKLDLGEDVYDYTVRDDAVLFTDPDSVLFYFDGDESIEIEEEVWDFEFLGDSIIYLNMEDELMISDTDGDTSRLEKDIEDYYVIGEYLYAISYDGDVYMGMEGSEDVERIAKELVDIDFIFVEN